MAADQPVAFIAVRLNDVAPDGTSARVTYGLLNLTHRDSHEHPEPLDPGKFFSVKVTMNDVAYAFPAGHKLRLALSTGYWPIAWPTPKPVTLSFFAGKSFLDLPVRAPHPSDAALKPFEPPERAAAELTERRPPAVKRILERDRTTNETVYTVSSSNTESPKLTHIKAIDLDIGQTMLKRFRIDEEDPATARAEIHLKTWFCRGVWKIRVETHTRLASDSDSFILQAEIRAYEDEEQFFRREWVCRVKRELL
jgi:hypothetical protein